MNPKQTDSVTPDWTSLDKKEAKILIVDDVSASLNTLYAILSGEGYKILAAPNGEIALKNAKRIKPDIILLDIMMPNLDGYQVCRELKQDAATADIPVIFITVREEKESLHKAFRVGGVDYITKPFDRAYLW